MGILSACWRWLWHMHMAYTGCRGALCRTAYLGMPPCWFHFCLLITCLECGLCTQTLKKVRAHTVLRAVLASWLLQEMAHGDVYACLSLLALQLGHPPLCLSCTHMALIAA